MFQNVQKETKNYCSHFKFYQPLHTGANLLLFFKRTGICVKSGVSNMDTTSAKFEFGWDLSLEPAHEELSIIFAWSGWGSNGQLVLSSSCTEKGPYPLAAWIRQGRLDPTFSNLNPHALRSVRSEFSLFESISKARSLTNVPAGTKTIFHAERLVSRITAS